MVYQREEVGDVDEEAVAVVHFRQWAVLLQMRVDGLFVDQLDYGVVLSLAELLEQCGWVYVGEVDWGGWRRWWGGGGGHGRGVVDETKLLLMELVNIFSAILVLDVKFRQLRIEIVDGPTK